MLSGGGGHPYKSPALGFGFTIAEVLVTIAIIGVVIAMTLPSIIQKHQEKELVTAYLRIYAILENAYKMAQVENGTFDNWAGCTLTLANDGEYNRTASNGMMVFDMVIRPYVKTNVTIKNLTTWNDKNCWPDKSNDLFGDDASMDNSHRVPAVSLMSGECIILGHPYADFMVDLNGKKRPNTIGKDQFMFSFDITKRTRLKPGYYQRWWTDSPVYCHESKSSADAGWTPGASCGFWILRYHNMDYLHMSYEELKKKWNGGWW